ncbi:ParA family protein [Actinomadura violacea]|uniref:ParA family protein n=1 Tax=Actinomadura violacea TaxID=2819934 RepID=A0ABS3S9M8_9ACTN|nr:ParA family protein [Actinomadura violacea]MBO2464934.1 ParA family protein [Actinomadura violacea]
MVVQAPEQLLNLDLKQFSGRTSPSELNALVDLLRPSLRRVIAVFNGKGGQGKTSVTTHVAGLLAEAEQDKAERGLDAGRVLVLEMDSQGNTLLDLGVKGHPLNDNGESLAMALQYGTDPKIIRDVRPFLDVIPSGVELEQLPVQMVALVNKRGRAAWLSLAVMLAKLAHIYRWIVIDCPPVTREPQELALGAARWVLTPVSTGDQASVDGLGGVAHRFQSTEDLNPDLELLGAVLFGFTHRYRTDRITGEKRPVGLWVETRRRLEQLLQEAGSDAPVFDAVIRSAETVAVRCRDRGQLTFEVGEATDGIKWWQKARGESGTVLPTDRAEAVGGDYESLTVEVVKRITEIEREEEEAAV